VSSAQTPLDVARGYHRRGWPPIPVPPRSKNPGFDGWQDLVIDYDDLPEYFSANGEPQNVSVLVGAPAGGLLDVDLDTAEARALARYLLPHSDAVFGRQSAPRSHHLYVATDPGVPRTKKWQLVRSAAEKVSIVEIRSTGGHTVFPGSEHETGEAIRWDSGGEPAPVGVAELQGAVRRIAAGALLVPCWRRGARNDLSLALAGALLYAGWTDRDAADFIGAIAAVAGDEEASSRRRNVQQTRGKLDAGREVWGLPKLAELIADEIIIKHVAAWLGLGRATARAKGCRASDSSSNEDQEGADAPCDADRERRGETQAAKLVRLAETWELFHTAQGDAYATFRGDAGEQQTWPLRTRGAGVARDRLEQLYYTNYGSVPGSQAVQDALGVLAGQARFAGSERDVFVRLAEQGDAIVLDLCDRAWRVVEVRASGWRVIPSSEVPVRFRRSRGMLALPEPRRGGSIDDLRPFVNVPHRQDGHTADGNATWILIVAWLLAALRPRGPYPILVCSGEQGTAKSTLQRVLRALVDPHRVALRRPPRDERDLAIAAGNSWLLGLENVSALPDWLSDALCALSTGGGYATRALWENDEEALFDSQRPVMINGIPVVVTRGDALDRSLILHLPEIADEARLAEEDFWRRFEQVRPGILGALLDGVATALRRKAEVALDRLPRMADFALWVTAAEPGVGWPEGTFMAIYDAERAAAHEVALQASPLAGPLWKFVKEQSGQTWSGTATELLDALNAATAEQARKRKGWPTTAHHLSGELSRLAPHFRPLGLVVDRGSGRWRRCVELRLESVRKRASPASPASRHAQDGDAAGLFGDAGDAGGDAEALFGDADAAPIYAQGDAGDAGDADLHQYSQQASGGLGCVANVSRSPKVPYPTEPCAKGHQAWDLARSDPFGEDPDWYGLVCRECRPVDQFGCWLPREAYTEESL
jgi:hypothetical protein